MPQPLGIKLWHWNFGLRVRLGMNQQNCRYYSMDVLLNHPLW
jgi:hypothetical protein